jgi:hypothetical protein
MRKLLDSGFGSSDHCVLRRGRPPGCRAIAAGPRLTFDEEVTLRFQLPHRRFERDRMGPRQLAATRPVGLYRNGEEPGHS